MDINIQPTILTSNNYLNDSVVLIHSLVDSWQFHAWIMNIKHTQVRLVTFWHLFHRWSSVLSFTPENSRCIFYRNEWIQNNEWLICDEKKNQIFIKKILKVNGWMDVIVFCAFLLSLSHLFIIARHYFLDITSSCWGWVED